MRTFDVGHDDAGYFIVIEHVEAEPLTQYVRQRDLLPPNVALAVTYQVALGLEYAAGLGVINYDTSARNILITGDGVPRVADMGLGRFFEPPEDTSIPSVETVQA